jgi:hypothetical protein
MPALVRREDGSDSHTVDGVPCLHLNFVAVGPTREEEEILLSARIAGTADENVAWFYDPPGQPEPIVEEPLLTRVGGAYQWSRPRERIRVELDAACRDLWTRWSHDAARTFAAAPTAWVEACERVAALDNPGRWMARGAEEGAPLLADLALPVRVPWLASVWTAAFIGFGGVLNRFVSLDSTQSARIAAVAAIVSAGRKAGHA